jgi:serine/threonine-protein kinase RsbW
MPQVRSSPVFLSIVSQLSAVSDLATSARQIVADFGLDEESVFEFELALVEVLNNAIEHAYMLHPDHRVDVVLYDGPGTVTVEVKDQGTQLPLQALEHARTHGFDTVDATAEGGRGLALVVSLADALGYRPGPPENVFWFSKNKQKT